MDAIVFCGIQGSGKSTFYRDRFFHTHVRLNLDQLRTRNREDILLHACLAAQQPFVADNTNATVEARQRYCRLAHAAGYRCSVYYFHATVDEAIRRNADRPAEQQVPDIAIRGTFNKLQPPTRQEGFDAAYRVTVGHDGRFIVEELP
jgi:predicted kinase